MAVLLQSSNIVAMCTYKDLSGVFTTETQELQQEDSASSKPAAEVTLETSVGADARLVLGSTD